MRNRELVRRFSLTFALGALGGALGIPLIAAATFAFAPVGWLLVLMGGLAVTAVVFRPLSPRASADGWRVWRATVWLLVSAAVSIPLVAADRQPALIAIALPIFTGAVAVAIEFAGRRLFGQRVPA
jgi:hypothetical protein